MEADGSTQGRNLVVAVPAPLQQDPEVTMGPLRWVLDQAWRDGDLVHIVHVVETMVQKLEVYHGMPGTSFSFEDPGAVHHEDRDISMAKAFLRDSVEPILEASGVKHQMHLSIETLDAPASAIVDVITKVADQVAAELVVLGANRKPVSAEDVSLGKVAKYVLEHLKRPFVLVRPFQPVPAPSR